MWRGLRLVVVLSMCLQMAAMAVGPSSAYAADGAEPIAQGIASFGQKLDEIGFLDALGEPIPLTAVSPSDDRALRLYRLFGDSLGDGLAGFSGDLDDLAHRLAIDLSGSYDGVALSFTDVTSATTGSVTDFSFTVTASRADSLPVAYSHEWVEEPRPGVTNTVSLDLSGGGFTPTLQLSTQLHFQYDSGGDPALYLAEAPTFDLSVAASGPIQPFEDLFGFTEIEVRDRNLALNDHITVDLVDPDDDGKITPDEWTYTASADLFAVQRPEAGQPGQGIDVTLDLEAKPVTAGAEELVPGFPDGYLELADNDLTDGLAPPTDLELGELARLDNVQADDVLAGLASLASGLIAAQSRADGQLPNGRFPFLGNTFSDVFSVGKPLDQFIQQQGDAAILCGLADSDPPAGDAWRVAANTRVYCQAITVSDAETVSWAIAPGAGTILPNGVMTTTVGPNPTASAAFEVWIDGSLPISVTFTLPTDPAGVSHTVTPRFRSAQELFGKLSAFPGLNLGAGDVAYDPTTSALTYDFTAEYDPEKVGSEFEFGDQLQEDTGLISLEATEQATVAIDAELVTLDLTFGAILVDNYQDINPDNPGTGLGDRFFVQVHEGPEVWVDDIAFPSPTVDLVGNVGFVGVTAEGNRPFEIKPSGGGPMLGIDFIAPSEGIRILNTGTISDAILIRDLLSDTLTTIVPEIHIDASAGLTVTAEVEDAGGNPELELGQGTVTITWTDITANRPQIVPDPAFVNTLQVFDVKPSHFGLHSGPESHPFSWYNRDQYRVTTGPDGSEVLSGIYYGPDDVETLVDMDRDFLAAGVTETHTIQNLTQGEMLTITAVTSHSVICDLPDTLVVAGGEGFLNLLEGNQGQGSQYQAQLLNLTDGSGCSSFTILDDNSLQCELEGGLENDWDPGDRYEIVGDPNALRDRILDSLLNLAYRMDVLTPTQVISGELYFSGLPLLGLSPSTLASPFETVREAVEDVRAGLPDATIACGMESGSPPAGDLSGLTVMTNTVYCQATTVTPGPVTDVTWIMEGGEFTTTVAATPGAMNALTATVGISPTANAVFEVTDLAGPRVRVEFRDQLGWHSAVWPPSGLPPSLQRLDEAIESKLGLPPGGLMFSTMLLSNGAEPEVRHLVLELEQGLCTEGNEACTGGDQIVPKPGLRVQLDLGSEDLPSLVAPEPTDTAPLDYAARAKFDLGFALSASESVSDTVVLETTGLSLTMSLNTDELDFVANVGPLAVDVGLGTALTGTYVAPTLTGRHTGTLTSTTTLTDTKQDFNSVIPGSLVTNLTFTGTPTCTVSAVTTNTLTCAGGLQPPDSYWRPGDEYVVHKASTNVLRHPGAGFGDNLEEAELANVTDGSSCIIDAVTADTLTCAAPLAGGTDNLWQEGDTYIIEAVGTAAFDAGFRLEKDGVTPGNGIETFPIRDFVNDLRASLVGPTSGNDCGKGVSGDACARLTLRDHKTEEPLGELRFSSSELASSTIVSVTGTAVEGLRTQIADATLDFTQLTFGLDALRASLGAALDGNDLELLVPLIGSRLDAGAEITKRLRDDVLGRLEGLGTTLNGLGQVDHITPTLRSEIYAALGPGGADLLLDQDGDGVDAEDIAVLPMCGSPPTPCGPEDEAWKISDVKVGFLLGESQEVYDVPFDVGLPGVALFSDDKVSSTVTWTLSVTFGLNRDLGPYVEVADGDDLTLQAEVMLKDKEESSCEALDPLEWTVGGGVAGFSASRCLVGQIGILPVLMRDGDTGQPGSDGDNSPSLLTANVSVDFLQPDGALDRKVAYATLLQELPAEVELDAEAHLDLRFRSTTGFGSNNSWAPGFPTVLGTFHLSWDSGEEPPVSELVFKNLYMDAGPFFNQFLVPTVEKVQEVTNPLKPVVDTVTTPIPVLSDLSKMGGGGPITLFTLMQTISSNDLTLVNRLISFIQFVNNIPSGTGLIALGATTDEAGEFEIDEFLATLTGAQVSDPAAGQKSFRKRVIDAAKLARDLRAEEEAEEEKRRQQDEERRNTQRAQRDSKAKDKIKPATKKSGTGKMKAVSRLVKAGAGFEQAPGISFPFLQDSTQIFYALLGQDVTLVRVDFGMVYATVGMYYRFHIQAGPIPVALVIGGQATLKGRLALGFDTRGFGPLLSGQAGIESLSGSSLLDGIFLDDFDADGQDVAEIQLIVEVTAGAAVDLVIISVGVEAGLSILFSLDFDNRLHDPPGSGKLRIRTIANIHNPVCLFEFRTKGELFFRLFFEINLFLFKKRFSWEPFPRVVLWDESFSCEPPTPTLGHPDPNHGEVLLLNMGDYASHRGAFPGVIDETFIVRQITTGSPATVTVEAFGFVQQYENVEKIVARAGSGKDTIRLETGLNPDDPEGEPVAFTLESELYGGPGDDKLVGGDGNDVLHGDDGNDKIVARGGHDEIDGGANDDSLDGGFGHDVIDGGTGNDALTGGPGSDYLDGGAGNDTMEGGPGSTSGDNADLKDILIGGLGSDILRGHYGDDLLFGDRPPDGCSDPRDFDACYEGLAGNIASTPSEEGDGPDSIDGAQGNDKMAGGGGNDDLAGGLGHDWLYGNDGDDALDGDDDNTGTPDGDDHLYGGEGADTLLGRGGHDLLEGGLGDDLLHGGEGADDLLGGEDSDALLGEAGDDIMLGDTGTISSHTAGDHSAGRDTVLGLVTVDDLTGSGAVSCTLRVNVYGGLIDLDGDGSWGDTGQFEGYPLLAEGLDLDRNDTIDASDSGTLGSAFVVAGLLDLDGDGQATDDGTLAGVGIFGTSRGDADCMWGDVGADTLFGGASSDVMFGDAGTDYMEGNRQGDVMRGGQDADEMYGNRRTENTKGDPNDDADTMFGDSGDDIMEGNQDVDTMRGGMGIDRMLGGSSEGGTPDAGDVMFGDGEPDIMLGDNGTISEDGQLIETIDPQIGGEDDMQGNRGDDIMLGGAAGDDMWGNTGADIMLGDNGRVTRDAQAVVQRIETTDPDLGGVDTMEGNEEPDILLGGMDGDEIYGNEDADTILGDNGVVVRADGSPEANDIMTTDPLHGGSDTIEGNLGADLILGGSGGTDLPGTGLGDIISGNEGDDLILGDNGYIYRDASDVVESFESREPLSGGQDTIYGNADDDIAFGGTISDTISGGSGHDILLGDHGLFDMARPPNQRFLAIDTGAGDGGAGDTIHGDDGDDILLGQQGVDNLYGDAGQDDLTGGHNVPGAADAGDIMFGESDDSPGQADGSGSDVMLGDNGVISRTLTVTGAWEINLFNGSNKRVVQIFDVETLSDPEGMDPYAGAYGNDEMWGNDNDDLMWGQGGEDRMVGGAGDDYMEGNTASDLMYGDSPPDPLAGGDDDMVGGDDDMVGGTGPTTSDDPSTAIPGRIDSSTRVRAVLSGTVRIDVPRGDEMYGGAGADVMLGDNGIIERVLDADGHWVTLEYLLLADHIGGEPPRHPTGGPGARIDRLVQMVDSEPGRVAGSDLMDGGPGDDDLYGQFDDTQRISITLPVDGTIGDELAGGEGEDAMVGDQAVIDSYVVDAPTEWLEPHEPFIADHIFVEGTLMRAVTLTQIPSGGDDLMTGGPAGDWMHGGAGADLMNGNDGNDRLFGDRGDDAIWGGLHHDHLWGGYGADYLDVRPRDDDPQTWQAFAESDHYQDIDYVYGGWDQDAMQANVADEGPVPGDRLIDWVGAYNVYYLCPGLYGEFVVTRALSPGLIRFLQRLAEGDGAVDTVARNRSGYDEVAMVFARDAGDNSHPVHSDNPGHFTCGEADTITPTVRSLSIGLSFRLKGSLAEVTGEVLVVDEWEAAIPGATVTIDWMVPGGSGPVVQAAVTDKKGIATFMVPGGLGVYTLTVRDITLEGYVFDPERSQLTGSIEVEPGEKETTHGSGGAGTIYLPVIMK